MDNTDPAKSVNLREAALSGDYGLLRQALQSIQQTFWPELNGRIFIRDEWQALEENKTPPQTADMIRDHNQRDADALSDFVISAYKTDAPDHPLALQEHNAESLRQQTDAFYKNRLTQTRKNTLGHVEHDLFSFSRPDDPQGGTPSGSFMIAVISINTAACTHCKSSLASPHLSCQSVSPDRALWDRIEAFRTSAHEFAHAIEDFQETPEERKHRTRRDREVTANVFADLLTAQTLGPIGHTLLQYEIGAYVSNNLERYFYESNAPRQAAYDYITSQPSTFAAATPRDLLTKARELVRLHDPTRHMPPGVLADYMHFLAKADLSLEAVEQRLNDPTPVPYTPSQVFNDLLTPYAHASSGTGTDHEIPYPPAARELDRVTRLNKQQEQSLLDEMMMQNPLRPSSMRDLPTPIADYMENNPLIQTDFAQFNKSLFGIECAPVKHDPPRMTVPRHGNK